MTTFSTSRHFVATTAATTSATEATSPVNGTSSYAVDPYGNRLPATLLTTDQIRRDFA